ncbi:MAG: SDR family NAD(P)-dependent oxidoreductase [Algibacter sp.]|uniref:SDR family NAD(P)-dependent oxidoreductase n=1 Tax=Algibacter sp. TaxID=1872428 RepID=UPI00261B3731|nr:SDR family oxidoreductase [Algibacter sp.]MDG1729805.1 SDR family NAD(P)-dependent oxidoreductase [Algibacter sp.]MDG2177959.1 SDR family NAD(P)-dependent oxidoreductase [Algibacter sp.]
MKTIIIVGGSKGIGKAIVTNLLAHCNVINISRNAPDISHDNLTHHHCDVTKDELPEIEAADGLVYCPGSINLKPISRLSIDDFKDDFEINVLGAVKVIQKYLPILKNGTKPSIVLFSTVAAKLGMPYHASVAVSKSGVEGLVKSLGAELAPTLRINTIAPTVTDTELASKLLRNEKMIDNITERHPLKKFLSPKEVADMAEFLLSDSCASISGQIFEMDCGIVSFKI